MKYNYIIVGQGIAGTMLAHSLIKRNKKVVVIDQPVSCTSLAIGHAMYSPIIFKRFTKAWMIDSLLSCMISTYENLEDLLKINFLHKKVILRIFASEQEKKLWLNKSMEEAYWPYLDDTIIQEYAATIRAPFGYGYVKTGNCTAGRQ
jgi:hypothetical protein